MNNKPLLQLILDTEKNELQVGMCDGLSEEDVEFIMATMEVLGNRILKSISKV